MAVSYRHGLSILEVVVYIPALFMALWMAYRHGFGRSSGWIFFVIFSLLRVIGSCCYLATISNPTSTNLYITWAVCNSIGLSPLTLACIGLLSRVNDSIKRKTGNPLPSILFRFTGVITLVGLILSIVGQTASSDPTNGLVNAKTKIGLIMFLIAWVGLCILLLLVGSRYRGIEDGEHRLLLAVGLSIPLLLVRLIYSLLVAFTQNPSFNMITGNVTIMLVMDVLEEIIIVLICLGIGLTLSVRQSAAYIEVQTSIQSTEHNGLYPRDESGKYLSQNDQNIPNSERRQRQRRRGGPITQLVGLVIDEINARRQ
ncbi:hypothetical protein VTN96DRAFT_6318 [Rasamsonia emersonii]|uniref:DUF7702 domain-containing protein n=1 Tax=Rasamsonia emersonii (strain ATCC 16479 / CBS 393.64 / IMI 116815) TaxID=1408163 RepID=A0A0F4YL34_RASE3|nr:Uncharacterized protein T310_7224 [Rasamsonia emersonii CBS 393.64]KKA18815.1 Uncharacterized protein T310_7224 [Rasamsonia emersonii CBS 393.64]